MSIASFQKGDRLIIIDGLAGSTTTITVENVDHEAELVCYISREGAETFALYEEVIKKL